MFTFGLFLFLNPLQWIVLLAIFGFALVSADIYILPIDFIVLKMDYFSHMVFM